MFTLKDIIEAHKRIHHIYTWCSYGDKNRLFTTAKNGSKGELLWYCLHDFDRWVVGGVNDEILWKLESKSISLKETFALARSLHIVRVADKITDVSPWTGWTETDGAALSRIQLIGPPALSDPKKFCSYMDSRNGISLVAIKGFNRLGDLTYYYTMKPSPAAIPFFEITKSEEELMRSIQSWTGDDSSDVKQKIIYW